MAPGVLQMVFEPIAILEHALAQVTVVLVMWRLLDVGLQRNFAGELLRANTTPIFVRVMHLVAGLHSGG